MAQYFFDEPYVVATILNRAFNDQSPVHAVYTRQVEMATSAGNTAYALQFGAAFNGLSEEILSAKLLVNLGVWPNAGLHTALTDYLVSVGKANVGVVALQLGQLLSGLENATGDQAAFSAAAVAWNKEVVDAYAYSSNPANVSPSPVTNAVTLTGMAVVEHVQ
ncbi:hypothetical protein [Acidovorax sp.]|uniref:hypothetical protein n=1 Tax=Acidovorax sp. TaxID=1872122 RepID=UPI00391F74D9